MNIESQMMNANMKKQIGLLRKLLFVLVFGTGWLFAPVPAKAAQQVLIIAGAGGEEAYSARFLDQVVALQGVLTTKYGYLPEEIHILAEDTAKIDLPARRSSADNIRRVFGELQGKLTRNDALLVFLIGHGSFDGQWAKFNLPGPDLRDIDFAALLDRLPVQRLLLVNCTSASGPFLEKLSHKDRVIITATRNGIERNATYFGQFFIEALQEKESADINKDGWLSATEAFVFARDRLVRHYADARQLRPEHPMLDDTGDGAGTETPDLLTGDGRLASHFFLEQQRGASKTAGQPAAPALSAEQKRILAEVEALKARKDSMPEQKYYEEFEKLMLELAKLNAERQ